MSDASRLSYSIVEAGIRCGWTRTRTFQLVAAGLLKTYKIGKRRFVSETALRECITRLEAATQQADRQKRARRKDLA